MTFVHTILPLLLSGATTAYLLRIGDRGAVAWVFGLALLPAMIGAAYVFHAEHFVDPRDDADRIGIFFWVVYTYVASGVAAFAVLISALFSD